MAQRTCTLDGCDRKHYAKGFCHPCYLRARANDPSRPRCSEPECDKALYARGLCRKHYCDQHLAGYWDRPEVKAKSREASRQWAERNKERRYAAISAWHRANREKCRASHRRWLEANPERARQLRRENQARRKARMLATMVEPIDYGAILRRHGMVCHLCRRPIPHRRLLHFDHVIPLARGGPHVASNIRPAHKRCNLSKGSRVLTPL